jgi:hypothetical protein
MHKRALAVGIPLHIYQKVSPALRGYKVETLHNLARAARALGEEEFLFVLVSYPLMGASAAELVAAVRAAGSKCPNAPVIVLVLPGRMDEARAELGGKVSLLLGMDEDPKALQAAIQGLLRVDPRLLFRIIVRVQMLDGEKAPSMLCKMENISASGVLVHALRTYPPGTPAHIEFMFPQDPVPFKAEAEVARQTGGKESMVGMGFKFLDFEGDSLDRLKGYLDKKL